jgi:mycofactocin precursor peptide peptidase
VASEFGKMLGDQTWSAIAAAPPAILLIPIGSCEQHGPHLPLDTDTRIALALATEAAAKIAGALVAPPLTVTASGEHRGFAGTLSIGTDVLRLVLVELVRSADWAERVVFVNGHGGNVSAVRDAAEQLHAEGRGVRVWSPSAGAAGVPAAHADAHAGRFETSLMLAVAPAVVRLDLGEAGDTRPLSQIVTALRDVGVQGVSANGVLGDPRGATAAEGERWLLALVDDLVETIQRP